MTLPTNTVYKEGTLYSNVSEIMKKRNYISVDDNGWVKNFSDFFEYENSKIPSYLNAKGVCLFDEQSIKRNEIFGIKFNIPNEVISYLKDELGIRGLFFVRQKCIPNIIAQCYLLPMDEVLESPVIETINDSKYITECFVTNGEKKEIKIPPLGTIAKGTVNDRLIDNNYEKRLYTYKDGDALNSISNKAYAAICPDFLLN